MVKSNKSPMPEHNQEMKADRFRFRAWDQDTKSMRAPVHVAFASRQFSEMLGMQGLIFMQSTGLLDKNGKEIFEGDIIEDVDDRGFRKSISFDQRMAAFHGLGMVHSLCEVEVIGNIYQNPELLAPKENICTESKNL